VIRARRLGKVAGSSRSRRVAQRSRRVEIARTCRYDNWKGGMVRVRRRGGSDRAQNSGGTTDAVRSEKLADSHVFSW
jgi:hypothetical protein